MKGWTLRFQNKKSSPSSHLIKLQVNVIEISNSPMLNCVQSLKGNENFVEILLKFHKRFIYTLKKISYAKSSWKQALINVYIRIGFDFFAVFYVGHVISKRPRAKQMIDVWCSKKVNHSQNRSKYKWKLSNCL